MDTPSQTAPPSQTAAATPPGSEPQEPVAGPSRTAIFASAARAAHLIVDGQPTILADTVAEALLGDAGREPLGYHRAHGTEPVLASLRTQVICRGRFMEDRVADAVAAGVDQYVILGAGLDTFAYRSDLLDRLRVFEVDQPATQRWKRMRLAQAGIAVPDSATFVPVDLEHDPLMEQLSASGFDPSRPAVVNWLGVSMYLSREALNETVTLLGGLAAGSELVMDYLLPKGARDSAGQRYVDLVSSAVAQSGEPWRTYLTPDEAAAMLDERGFDVLTSVSQAASISADLWNRTDAIRPSTLLHLVHARVRA